VTFHSIIAATSLAFLLISSSAYAAKNMPQSPSYKLPKNPLKPDANPLATTHCWTNVQGCAGLATFGNYRYNVNCRIWFANGAVDNFSLAAGQGSQRMVSYGDMGACIAQPNPMRDQPRFPIYVN
jgi:hypothetical protein